MNQCHSRHCHITLLLILVSTACIATQHRVGTGQKEKISDAIARCNRGDTLIIPSGIYTEPTIIVDKPIFIRGENFPVLDGQRKNEIMAIRSDSVKVYGLHFRNSGRSDLNDLAAIKVYKHHSIVIQSNIIENSYFAIYLEGTSQSLIINNYVRGTATSEMSSANGIHCWYCDSLRIFQNTIVSHRDGIYFEFVTNSVVLGNYSRNNIRYGLHFMFSHNDTYTSNVFESNGAGVAVMYTKGVVMIRNIFRHNWGPASYGILLKDISDSKISGNLFEENTIAIRMEGSSRMKIYNNNFFSNGWALQIQASSTDAEITSNNFLGNSFDLATNGEIDGGIFDGNYWDKYEGYDIDRDGRGDVPFHPSGLYSVLVERLPSALILYRSPITSLMDKAEKVMPVMTPVELSDNAPAMKSLTIHYD